MDRNNRNYVQYVINPSQPDEKKQQKIPWGINKLELKALSLDKIVKEAKESEDCILFSDQNFTLALFFNDQEQLYQISSTKTWDQENFYLSGGGEKQ